MNEDERQQRQEQAKARRRIARIKQPDIRAMAYFVQEMRNADGVTIRAALNYLTDRYTYRPSA